MAWWRGYTDSSRQQSQHQMDVSTASIISHSSFSAFDPPSNKTWNAPRLNRPYAKSLPAIIIIPLGAAILGGLSYLPVYGSPFRLPGKFFDIIKCTPTIPHQVYLDDLRHFMQELKPTQPRMPHSQKIFVSQELKTSTHAFVRKEVKKKSLTPPY
ncbi:unnamed protein product [Ixodes persulcatus]